MAQWTNSDGLTIWFNADQATRPVASYAQQVTMGAASQLVVDINYDNLPAETTDINNNGTNNGWNGGDPFIPAGSFITNAYLLVETAFAGGTSYDIGTYQLDGTVIDANGVDAAILTAALAANLAVVCNGAQVRGTALITSDAYLKVAATGTFTAGKAKLVIEYITVSV